VWQGVECDMSCAVSDLGALVEEGEGVLFWYECLSIECDNILLFISHHDLRYADLNSETPFYQQII
jgi:hypothetical protein